VFSSDLPKTPKPLINDNFINIWKVKYYLKIFESFIIIMAEMDSKVSNVNGSS
jgi:hypothetical protein